MLTAIWIAFALFSLGTCQGLISEAGLGHAVVTNRCSFSVVFKSCINDNPSPQILRPNHMYRESYRINPDGGGVAIKLASNQTIQNAVNVTDAFDHSTITQFEYTYKPGIGIWYDISNVNGGNPWPFARYGLSLSSSSSSCRGVICSAGRNCTAGYILPGDNYAVHGCGSHQDLHLQLCWVGNTDRIIVGTPYSSCNCT